MHTHSEYATAWAQARKPIPCYGTTHADYFHGPVPVTEMLRADEVGEDYVRNTGEVIVRCFRDLDPVSVPAVLVAGHAPFCWGKTIDDAVHHAVALEYVARLALHTETLARSGCRNSAASAGPAPQAQARSERDLWTIRVGRSLGITTERIGYECFAQRHCRDSCAARDGRILVAITHHHIAHLAPLDIAIIAVYFAMVIYIGFYLKRRSNTRRGIFPGWPGDDGLDCRAEFHLRQYGLAGVDGLGGRVLSIRHSGDALVLDRRHPGHALSRPGDDAVLLRFEDAFRAGISEAAFWRIEPPAWRRFPSPS